jgi:ankyrin repeat protein
MFPNPQTALPLPLRPSLERYRKLAKELSKACKSGDERAIGDWAEQWVHAIGKLNRSEGNRREELDRRTSQVEDFAHRRMRGGQPAGRPCTLAAAQFVIARLHGFESWPKFARHLEALHQSDAPVSRFEAAADAIVNGDVAALKRLLREDPDLLRARSTREHGATLLHYVSANGVEGYRQKTPKNIVEIAGILLHAGADVDAAANVYGGGCTALGLAATSIHPEQAGVQEELLEALLNHGAQMEPPPVAGNQQSIVIACLENGRSKAAEFLASRGAPLDLAGAAAVGNLGIVRSFIGETGGLPANTTREQLNAALTFACGTGRNTAIELLLGKGADLAAQRGGQTGLHWAVIGGHLETVQLLLRNHARR